MPQRSSSEQCLATSALPNVGPSQILPFLYLGSQEDVLSKKARLSNGRVFIHCLAGISRSPALAVAYIMRHLSLSVDDAYRYIKARRS
ncbi:unnamed protein product, partial [Rotaria magnacalcarata]